MRIRLLLICIYFFSGCLFRSFAEVPVFDADNAFRYLEKQCAFGPRNPGSEGHQQCLLFLESELKKYANRVQNQTFEMRNQKDSTVYTLTNIQASFGNASKQILLCAHWDTRPWADEDPDPKNRNTPIIGANDGASGVAVLLEMAKILKAYPPPVGINIVLFDGEDSGIGGSINSWCKGSEYYVQNLPFYKIPEYVLLLDLIGDSDLHIPVEKYSKQYAPHIVDLVWNQAALLGFSVFDASEGAAVIDDHIAFLKKGIPAVDIIDFDYPYWHTIEDTPDKCSPESLGMVGNVLVHLIYE